MNASTLEPSVKRRIGIERRIIRQIAKTAIAQGFYVTVHDGEAVALKRSRNVTEVMHAIMSVDEERLYFSEHPTDGKNFGMVFLVYGNDGFDVIADHTDTEIMRGILAPAEALAERIESAGR